MVTWVLEKNIFSEKCFDLMINHFQTNDIPYHTVKVIPFVHTIECREDIMNIDKSKSIKRVSRTMTAGLNLSTRVPAKPVYKRKPKHVKRVDW